MPGHHSSTTALGHIGTGIGTHGPSWVHYNLPASGNTRVVHTRYNYTDANQKIQSASATKGHVSVKSITYDKTTTWRCGNGTCPGSQVGGSMPARSGCPIAKSREHSWNQRNVWVARAQANKALYYDKGGSTTQVSYHSF